MVGGIIPLVYFIMPNKSKLRLGKTQFDGKALLKTCTNGSSEFMSNISLSVVSMLYNYQLMKLSGEDGVSTYGVLMYVNFIFIAAFIGYSVGSAPIVGYHHGAGNHDELKCLFRKSLVIIGAMSVTIFALAELLAVPLGNVIVGYDDKLLEMTVHAFSICSLIFTVCGFNIYGSGFFTALNNGLLSALISFARTLVFQVLCVLLLPVIFGLNGIWCSVVVSDVLALVLTAVCLIKERKVYHYA